MIISIMDEGRELREPKSLVQGHSSSVWAKLGFESRPPGPGPALLPLGHTHPLASACQLNYPLFPSQHIHINCIYLQV